MRACDSKPGRNPCIDNKVQTSKLSSWNLQTQRVFLVCPFLRCNLVIMHTYLLRIRQIASRNNPQGTIHILRKHLYLTSNFFSQKLGFFVKTKEFIFQHHILTKFSFCSLKFLLQKENNVQKIRENVVVYVKKVLT